MKRALCIAAIVLGTILVLGETPLVPQCRNYRGTDRDSGYPCRLDRSNGNTQYLFSSRSRITIPLGIILAVGLLGGGISGLATMRKER